MLKQQGPSTLGDDESHRDPSVHTSCISSEREELCVVRGGSSEGLVQFRSFRETDLKV
jgi:hypothetical protein